MASEKADLKKELARYLLAKMKQKDLAPEKAIEYIKELQSMSSKESDYMAIVGLSCKFPDADSPDEFWDNLAAGKNSIKKFPASRTEDCLRIGEDPSTFTHGGFLQSVDQFDPEYFNIPPRVAEKMDPYHRMMLQVFIEAIEDAGYHRGQVKGREIGIFVGNDHTHRLVNSYFSFVSDGDFTVLTGSWTGVLASRLSYILNLKGPALVLDTACSSSLVAIDSAIKAIQQGDCEAALVGGANLLFTPGSFGVDIQSTDYTVRTFDYRAEGTAWGEGIGAVYIKPLSKALADRDHIYGVIRGVAVNNDGASNGLTAPNARAQQEVLLRAWERAGIAPETISYIETHGTGTKLGDPIEIKGLSAAFAKHSKKRQFCAIGSVKTNIGHTVGAAGLASLAKVLLSLRERALPPSLNFSQPNPLIDFPNSPVYIQDALTEWKAGDTPRRAGISSFSLNGTNAHLVVEEAPADARPSASAGWRILPLSGKSEDLLRESVNRYAHHLRRHAGLRLEDISFTASTGREHEPVRAAILCRDLAGLQKGLETLHESLTRSSIEGAMREDGFSIFANLAHAAADSGADAKARTLVTALAGEQERENRSAWEALSECFVKGATVDFEPLFAGRQVKRCSLPSRVFNNQRYWDESKKVEPRTGVAEAVVEQEITAELLWAQAQTAASRLSEVAEETGQVERFVAWVWSEILGYPKVDPDMDFYSLGGDSVTGLRIVQCINLTFGVEVPVSVLMGTPMFDMFVGRLKEEFGVSESVPEAQKQGTEEPVAELIVDETPFPLSPAQNMVFLTASFQPSSLAYNVTGTQRVKGSNGVEEAESILKQLIRRHDSLRTSFHMEGDTPMQRVHAHVDFAVERSLLKRDASKTRAEQVQEELADFVRPFDLGQAPMLRARYIAFDDGVAYLSIDMHHIITDGTSMGVLFRDYVMLAEGRKLAPLTLGYKDAVEWLHSRKAEPRFQKQREWWMSQFADGAPLLNLPTDKHRRTTRDFRGDRVFHTLSLDLTHKLKSLAKSSGATLFMVMMGAFHHLLARIGNERDVVIGTPVAGRSRMELHQLVGMFVNTLPVRTKSSEDDTFLDFLAQLKKTVLGAYENQDYPYESLIDDLKLERIPGRNPLFDVYFAMQNIDMGLSADEDDLVSFESGSSKFDMTVSARETNDGLLIEWEYSKALYHRNSIERLVLHFQSLLAAIVENPQSTLGELEFIAESERRLMLQEWNETSTAYPGKRGIVPLFEEVAAKHGDDVALILDDQHMTYDELNRRSNQVARAIQAQGAAQGTAVALLFDRSFDMIAAMFGVLKAGCHYLPLDMGFPANRLKAMIDDCEANVLVTHRGLDQSVLGEQADGLSVLSLDDLSADTPGHNLGLAVSGDDLAYIIFTSGSTGTPKGTVIRQDGVIRVVRDAIYLDITAQDAVLQLSNYSFDGATFDIYGALLNGARLVLVRKQEVIDPKLLGQRIRENGVTVLFITTALFNALVDASPECLDGTRKILFGGEAASIPHVRKAFDRLGPNRLQNVYGPTETTVYATYYPIDEFHDQPLPIGKALGNTTLYVLDDRMRLQPIGVPGELFIGGAGLAVGYLKRPDLTEERFVPHPFQPGERLYRTGDIVAWGEDGYLRYLGRRDHQVKLRGFRIELPEIESAAVLHPSVREASAGVHESETGAKNLCLWVVPNGSIESFDADAVRQSLAQKLPDYMVPTFIVPLAVMPLNKNGKVDKATLPAPMPVSSEQGREARDEQEVLLVEVWSKVLGVRPSIDDNFFSLGGDSIKAIQVVAKVQEAGLGIDMASLFQYQTIESLAPHLQAKRRIEAEQGEVTGEFLPNVIQSSFLTHVTRSNHFTQAMMIQGVSGLDKAKLEAALTRLCHHHDALRVAVDEKGGIRLRGQEEGTLFVLEELTAGMNDDALLAVHRRLDLANGPVVAAAFSAAEGKLMLAIHHLVVDVVSWTPLLEDLFALMNDPRATLPLKTTPLPVWTKALTEWAQNGGAKSELPYWREMAKAAQEETAPLAPMTFRHGDTENAVCTIGGETGAALCGEANQAYHTDTVHLVLSILTRGLSGWLNTPAFLLNLEGHGREEFAPGLDVSRTVGWFTSTYPMLMRAPGEVGNTVKAIKESIKSVPRRGFGYGVLKTLTPDLQPEDSALLDALRPAFNFNYLGIQGGSQNGITVDALSGDLTIDGDYRTPWALDIVGSQVGSEVLLEIRYAKTLFSAEEMNDLLHFVSEAATEVARHCLERPNGEKTASDFTASPLRQEELESILDDLDFL